ncbi:MAG: PadR family transcriptional regulator [Acidobacteria bacterium]|nr:PadR family transcriptional regulator [Acidobacteriota bacterium]
MRLSKSKKRKRGANPLGLAVLALLFEKPMHPYEMASTLRERAKDQSIKLNYGSLYTVIGSLERNGLISAREKEREGARPERTVYAITAEGESELFDWMRDLVGTPVKEYPRFEAALSLLPILPPSEAKALLQERVRLLDEELDRLRRTSDEASRQGVARLFLIEGEYYAAMCEAERKWVIGLIRLISASPSFTRGWKALHEQHNKSGGKPARRRRAGKPRDEAD